MQILYQQRKVTIIFFSKIKNFCNKKGILTWDARFPNLFDFWISPAFKEIEKNKYDIIISTFAPILAPVSSEH